MAYILHIESSSTVCSVAISDNLNVLAIKELDNGYTHSENLHTFIQAILQESKLEASQLNAISVSSGPGSYTGLRIGYSTAKGLAYALQIPLININTLQALTVSVVEKITTDAFFCPMLDARREEVYCSLFSNQLIEEMPTQALILNEENIHVFNKNKAIYFFGDGMPKAKKWLAELPNAYFVDEIKASANFLVPLAYQKYLKKEFADLAYSEPLYLKEFFFAKSKN